MREPEKPRPRSWKTAGLAWLIVRTLRILGATLRFKVERAKEIDALMQGGGILVTWHGRSLIPIWYFWERRRYFMLVSLSRDGDLQTEVLGFSGCGVVRGSTGRRGVAATREVLTKLQNGDVAAFTPDGPRGPIGVVQPGVVYFAKKSGLPIVPVGNAAWPRWELMNSWDQYMIPKPFAKARWLYGEPIFVAPEDDTEAACLIVQKAIDQMQARAEAAVRA